MKSVQKSKKSKKNTNQVKLSVVINTKNVAHTLEKTLRSVVFADEIIIVDAHSTDTTVNIAERYTKQIFYMDGPKYVEPYRNFALSKARHEWILVLDADEQIPEELQAILKSIMQEKNSADAYYLPRKNYIFNKWIEHTGWWPDYQLRFFRRGAVKWNDAIHSIPTVVGRTSWLPANEQHSITHDNYTSVSQFLEKLNLYTSIQAQEKSHTNQEMFSAEALLEIFVGEFVRRAYALNGVSDGFHGIALSLLQGMSEASVYLKQWEEKGFPNQNAGNTGVIMQKLYRVLAYWRADYEIRRTYGLTQIYWRVRRKLKW